MATMPAGTTGTAGKAGTAGTAGAIKFGAMNHPAKPLLKEIAIIGRQRFDFIDLTLERPAAYAPDVMRNISKVKKALKDAKLSVVGHTAWYLAIGSPIKSVRDAVLEELKTCVRVFEELGATHMNIHPTSQLPGAFGKREAEKLLIKFNADTVNRLAKYAKRFGITIMFENVPYWPFATVSGMKKLIDAVPGSMLHLDIGHANVNVKENLTPRYAKVFGKKLVHIHAHDNDGSADQHRAVGSGSVNWERVASSLISLGYDRTITLEDFTPDIRSRVRSRERLRKMLARSERSEQL